MRKRLHTLLLSVLIVICAAFGPTEVKAATSYSTKQIYHNIDMSAAVLASRTNQQVSGDCAVVSMATVEAFMYGATSSTDRKTVYNALVSKNKDNDYAYWGNCGYVSHSSINWATVYNNLSMGYPVIVHRPASGSKVQHWAVVAGYKGSTATLEKDKFIIVDVYHGSGSTDIYTSGSWRGSVSIDRMVTRKNGIAITGLTGIKMAINHPAPAHQYGNGHGVLGYIASDVKLTSVQVKVTNAATGADIYNKIVKPNAKSYLIFNLDSEMTFAKWAKGKYVFSVTAKTASSSRTYQYSFEIAKGWPVTEPKQSYVFSFNANGGTGVPANQTVYFGDTLHIPVEVPTRDDYTFLGWHVKRDGDQTWYSSGNGWYTDAQITAAGYAKRFYSPNTDYTINNVWLTKWIYTPGFTFYAQWEKNEPSPISYTVNYNANGGSGAPNSQTKTNDVALTLSSMKPTRTGYTFLGWATSAAATSVTYQPGDIYTANADTTLYAVWRVNFADISITSWQFSAASYAVEKNLMAGKGTDAQGNIIFDPNNSITREEFVQVLYNAEGKPSVSSTKVFPDVANNGWYRNAVMWANEKGIASGMGNGHFGVGMSITRQDLAMMLYKYAKMKGCSLAAEEGRINQFADGNKVAGYAKTAMDWAVTNGILSGKGESGKPLSTFKLDPTGTATRAECAAMLKNFMTAFGL